MASGTEHVSPRVHDYVVAHSSPPDALLRDLIEQTARRFPDDNVMQIGPEQGTFMTLLSRTIAPALAVEVGTFTGYSSICLARGLAHGGRLVCCDVSAEWTSLAGEFWQKAGLAEQIELRLGPALDTLRALPGGESIDLAFIDADKAGYVSYWEEIVPRTRSGGIILADNTLRHGRIFDQDPDPISRAIADFNEHVMADDRVELVLLSIGDGLTFARKRLSAGDPPARGKAMVTGFLLGHSLPRDCVTITTGLLDSCPPACRSLVWKIVSRWAPQLTRSICGFLRICASRSGRAYSRLAPGCRRGTGSSPGTASVRPQPSMPSRYWPPRGLSRPGPDRVPTSAGSWRPATLSMTACTSLDRRSGSAAGRPCRTGRRTRTGTRSLPACPGSTSPSRWPPRCT
jgi:caffeoyl-CoA O-methyltransferase